MRMYRCRNETDHVTKKIIKYVLFYFWNISLGLPLLGLRINSLSYFSFPANLSITTFLVMARPCVSFKYSAENEWGFCGWAHSDGGMRADGDTCRRVTLRQCQFLHLCFLTCLNLRERQLFAKEEFSLRSWENACPYTAPEQREVLMALSTVCRAMPLRVKELRGASWQ